MHLLVCMSYHSQLSPMTSIFCLSLTALPTFHWYAIFLSVVVRLNKLRSSVTFDIKVSALNAPAVCPLWKLTKSFIFTHHTSTFTAPCCVTDTTYMHHWSAKHNPPKKCQWGSHGRREGDDRVKFLGPNLFFMPKLTVEGRCWAPSHILPGPDNVSTPRGLTFTFEMACHTSVITHCMYCLNMGIEVLRIFPPYKPAILHEINYFA